MEEGDEIIIDIPNRRLDLNVPKDVLEERLKHVKPVVKPRTPALAKYAAMVTSADQGAVLRVPDMSAHQ